MQLPEDFISSCKAILGEEAHQLFEVIKEGKPPISIRLNPNKNGDLELGEEIPWCNNGYYLHERPSYILDPLFHAGCYYPQEASSTFLDFVLRNIDLSPSPTILDLCAAPGGKSTLIASFLNGEGTLVANEVINQRSEILKENCIKSGYDNIIVTNNDPQKFAKLNGIFDAIVVDAPCSGEGMFRKDHNAINEWSIDNVNLCCQRQKRILSDVLPALKSNGYLIYSTCTFNEFEDENNVKWLIEEFGFTVIDLPINAKWNITTSNFGYRFYPHKLKGEGFFISVLKAPDNFSKEFSFKNKKSKKQSSTSEFAKHLTSERRIIEKGNLNIAIKEDQLPILEALEKHLNIKSFGTELGEIIKGKLKFSHHLAMSSLLNQSTISSVEIDKEQALDYLRKKEININDTPIGFVLLTYKNTPLGWVKNLGNRTNNYYPKEWRIRHA